MLLTLALTVVAAALQEGQEMPKPGPEHELLKQFEGDWDVAAKFWMDPAQPPMETKGSETSKMMLGGFWLVSDFKGEMMGAPFTGHGVMGYSPMKKKYVGSWTDSMMPHLFVSEGDVDKSGKIWTMTAESFNPQNGEPVKEKWVIEIKDKDTRTMAFWMPAPDGKDTKTGEMTYTRRKK